MRFQVSISNSNSSDCSVTKYHTCTVSWICTETKDIQKTSFQTNNEQMAIQRWPTPLMYESHEQNGLKEIIFIVSNSVMDAKMCQLTKSSFTEFGGTYMHYWIVVSHYDAVIMSAMASQITSLTFVWFPVYSRRRSKKTSKLCVTVLYAGNSPVTGDFPAQRACNAENVSIWWRHHDCFMLCLISLPLWYQTDKLLPMEP